MEQMANQNLPGRKTLKVVGILQIIFGGLGTLINLLGAATIIASLAYLQSVGYAVSGGVIYASVAVSVAYSIFVLVAGILGVKYSNRKEKAKSCMTIGIILMVAAVLSSVLSYIATSALGTTNIASLILGLAFGLVLPVLYYVGAKKNMQA